MIRAVNAGFWPSCSVTGGRLVLFCCVFSVARLSVYLSTSAQKCKCALDRLVTLRESIEAVRLTGPAGSTILRPDLPAERLVRAGRGDHPSVTFRRSTSTFAMWGWGQRAGGAEGWRTGGGGGGAGAGGNKRGKGGNGNQGMGGGGAGAGGNQGGEILRGMICVSVCIRRHPFVIAGIHLISEHTRSPIFLLH
eukprot:1023243-Prorocentrum_minimum.AAC.1